MNKEKVKMLASLLLSDLQMAMLSNRSSFRKGESFYSAMASHAGCECKKES